MDKKIKYVKSWNFISLVFFENWNSKKGTVMQYLHVVSGSLKYFAVNRRFIEWWKQLSHVKHFMKAKWKHGLSQIQNTASIQDWDLSEKISYC